MVVMAFIMLYPFWYTLVYSFNNGADSARGDLYWWPRIFTIENYTTMFRAYDIWSAYRVTLARVFVGPTSGIIVTLIIAYAMTTPGLMFRKFYNVLIIIPMFFGGGLIPYFLLVNNLGLTNTFWVYIIPGMFGIWNFIMMRAYMGNIPHELQESARIDGAGELSILFRIILPICLPICACLFLFGAVGHWNAWMDAYIFNDRSELFTIQLMLRRVISNVAQLTALIEEQGRMAGIAMSGEQRRMMVDEFRRSGVSNEAVIASASIISIGPIVFLYPFLQRFFIKGIMIGSLKG